MFWISTTHKYSDRVPTPGSSATLRRKIAELLTTLRYFTLLPIPTTKKRSKKTAVGPNCMHMRVSKDFLLEASGITLVSPPWQESTDIGVVRNSRRGGGHNLQNRSAESGILQSLSSI